MCSYSSATHCVFARIYGVPLIQSRGGLRAHVSHLRESSNRRMNELFVLQSFAQLRWCILVQVWFR